MSAHEEDFKKNEKELIEPWWKNIDWQDKMGNVPIHWCT